MPVTGTPSTMISRGSTSTSAPPAVARLSSATRPATTALWPATAVARPAACRSAGGSSALPKPSSDDGGAAHQRQPHHRQRQRHRDRTYHGLCREKHDGRRDGRTPRQRDDQRGQARHLGHNAT